MRQLARQDWSSTRTRNKWRTRRRWKMRRRRRTRRWKTTLRWRTRNERIERDYTKVRHWDEAKEEFAANLSLRQRASEPKFPDNKRYGVMDAEAAMQEWPG
jgi:hypothetical protein